MPALPAELAGGRLTIDLDALADNWRKLAAMCPGANCGAVVKADGYGIGLNLAVETLTAAGCDTFFVAVPEEGLRARALAPDASIYVLDGLFEGAAPLLADARLRPVLGSMEEIREWAAFRRGSDHTPGCAIHVDTGMNRLGLSMDEATRLAADGEMLASLSPALVMSHFACADTPNHPLNAKQMRQMSALRGIFPDISHSFANSAALMAFPDIHCDVTRPGIALYGARAFSSRENPMTPVISLEARIIQIRDVAEGESVGYGATESAKRPTRIAIAASGYADGYLRRASSTDAAKGAEVSIAGHLAPVIGRISMDMMAIDVTGIPDELARRGAWVELFGRNISIDDVAERAETIGYELMTGLGRRYQRIVVGGERPGT